MSATTKETTKTTKKSNATTNSKKTTPPTKKNEAKKEENKRFTPPTREAIIACAADMNEKLGLDPAINTKLATQAIIRDILSNANAPDGDGIDFTDYNGSKADDEQITDETKATLSALGFKSPKAPKKADPAPTKPTADKKNDKKAAPTPPAKVKSAKEMKAEREAAKAAKKNAAPKYTRTTAFIDAIKKSCKGKGANFEKIMATVNELYTKNGHDDAATNDNAKKSRMTMLLDSLVAFNVLKNEKGTYTLNAE